MLSVFNKTYENLLEDGYVELTNFEQVISFMRQLGEDAVHYKITNKYDWWNGNEVWLIEVDK